MASTDFTVNIVMLINITMNKTFRIHVLVKNYSCYNVFDQKNVNTFNVLTLIQVPTDENKFTEIRNVDRFQCFNIQVSTDISLWKIKNVHGQEYIFTIDLCGFLIFFKVNKITKFLTCLKSVSHLCIVIAWKRLLRVKWLT